MSLAPGTRLGPYEVTAQIGAGGMGEVYRATDSSLKRQVAIKVLPASVAADRERLARFQREAEVLAALNHPHIAAIYGVEKSDGRTALVMELVEGPTLAERIAQSAIPFDEALPIARQIAEALEAAHEQGIVHRDLKPANIKVRDDGTVKVLDFGLAKAMEPAGLTASTSASISPTFTSPAMTQMGMILGTAAYMAPEQARGRAVDRRADVWAFGVVLYEMLTGRRAFDGEDVSMTLSAVLQREPDWAALPESVSAGLRVYLRRCLQKDPRQRVRDIGDVRLALDGAFETTGNQPESPVVPARAVPLWRRALTASAALILGGLAVGLAAWTRWPVPAPHAPARFAITLPEGQSFASPGRTSLALSPDGENLVYSANRQLYLRPMSGLDPRPIAGSEGSVGGPSLPVISPDGKSVGGAPAPRQARFTRSRSAGSRRSARPREWRGPLCQRRSARPSGRPVVGSPALRSIPRPVAAHRGTARAHTAMT
jgi:eukaryotic-like serine/threonine-protein kinase